MVIPSERSCFKEVATPRRSAGRQPDRTLELPTLTRTCPPCRRGLWGTNKPLSTVTTLPGLVRFRLQVLGRRNPDRRRYRVFFRPEPEERFAPPRHEFGLVREVLETGTNRVLRL
jgi:hypothetical protein